MELKYICKNDGYIIDRKLNPCTESSNTFTTKGSMLLTENLPENDDTMRKEVIEFAFDNMKENVLNTMKKKYSLKDEELVTFYFEGKLERKNDQKSKVYVKFENEDVPVVKTDFNLDFEVEMKVTPRNFLRVQFDNIRLREI